MEYQVTKPSFVRINWTQTALTFAACFVACLLAGGAIYAIIYFLNRKPKQNNGYDTQTQQQRTVRQKEKISDQVEDPQVIDQKSDQAQINESENQKEDNEETDEEKPDSQNLRLNGKAEKPFVKRE